MSSARSVGKKNGQAKFLPFGSPDSTYKSLEKINWLSTWIASPP